VHSTHSDENNEGVAQPVSCSNDCATVQRYTILLLDSAVFSDLAAPPPYLSCGPLPSALPALPSRYSLLHLSVFLLLVTFLHFNCRFSQI